MKFLYVMLSSIWVSYSWVCYDALQWKPPFEMPPHVREILETRSQEDIERGIRQAQLYLDSAKLTNFQRAEAKRDLATGYWLKAFFQDSRKTQSAYLHLSIQELEDYMKIVPGHKKANGWMADVYHILQDYETADRYYKEARKHHPEDRFFRIRHREMKQKWDRMTQANTQEKRMG